MATTQGGFGGLQSESAIIIEPAPKKSKAVNAFIMFRVYYSGAFPNMAQKYRSPLIKQMWAKDPYKGTWRCLGKVFTTIRDHVVGGGGKVDIHEFLSFACPQLGITSPESYCTTFQWKFQTDAAGVIQFIHNDDALITVEGCGWTSEIDIVQNCLSAGYEIQNQDFLLAKMRAEPETMFSFMPDAETRRTHFENLLLKNPLSAVSRLMRDQPIIVPDYSEIGVNVLVIDSHDTIGNSPLFTHSSATSYGGGSQGHQQLSQEALMINSFEWGNQTEPSQHGVDMNAVEHDEDALFDIGNPFGMDRLATDFAAANDDVNVESLWGHSSMTIKGIPPPKD